LILVSLTPGQRSGSNIKLAFWPNMAARSEHGAGHRKRFGGQCAELSHQMAFTKKGLAAQSFGRE
jgi:hypothetical protein